LSWGNSSNSAITPNIVVDDYWTLNISGAPPSVSVVLALTKNGGSLQYTTVGNTDGSGNYYQTAQVTNGSLGTYTNQWYAGGIAAGSEYDYEVIRRPSQLSVVLASGSNCVGGYPYGVLGSIDYDIEDSGGNLVTSNSVILYPYFNWNSGGTQPVSSASGGANSYGVFTYSPLYYCSTAAYGATAIGSEILYAKIGVSSVYETVRSQSWTASSSAPDSGALYNGTDIDITH
jgi:hypothetical protein